MNEENMNENFSFTISGNAIFNSDSNCTYLNSNDDFKNIFVLFYVNKWNDAGFCTLFNVYFFWDKTTSQRIGNIRICHVDLKHDNDKELSETRHFLQKDYSTGGIIDITDKLTDKYISIADNYFYTNLKIALGNDEFAAKFLTKLNEISTIEDNKRIEKIKSKDWYKKSFIREVENRKIVDFTKYKNDIE